MQRREDERRERTLDESAALHRDLEVLADHRLRRGGAQAHYDVRLHCRDLGFEPKTTIEVGLERFVEWYKQYYQVN